MSYLFAVAVPLRRTLPRSSGRISRVFAKLRQQGNLDSQYRVLSAVRFGLGRAVSSGRRLSENIHEPSTQKAPVSHSTLNPN